MNKIGLDVHGVIDLYPDIFSIFSQKLISDGCEVHIITGQEWDKVKPEVDRLGIQYTHHFSIVDYHMEKGTEMWRNSRGTWQMGENDWNRSKGEYIHREKIDIHFDDSWQYANWCPDFCTYILVPKTNFNLMGFISFILR